MLTITVDSKLVTDQLNQLLKRMSDLSPVMQGIGQELNTRISNRFETRTDPSGKVWAPWSEAYRETYPKDARGFVLERYGGMLKSLTFKADKSSVRVGFSAVASKTGDVYATYHEFGTDKMPRRGLLFDDPNTGTLSADDETAVLDIIGQFLSD